MPLEREPRCETIEANNGVVIKYSTVPTEFEIQSALYSEINHLCSIVDNHCDVLSEVTVCMDGKTFRFDLMLFRYSKPQCGIEVKKRSWKPNTPHGKQQANNYVVFEENTGIPVLYCRGMEQVEEIARKVGGYIY